MTKDTKELKKERVNKAYEAGVNLKNAYFEKYRSRSRAMALRRIMNHMSSQIQRDDISHFCVDMAQLHSTAGIMIPEIMIEPLSDNDVFDSIARAFLIGLSFDDEQIEYID